MCISVFIVVDLAGCVSLLADRTTAIGVGRAAAAAKKKKKPAA